MGLDEAVERLKRKSEQEAVLHRPVCSCSEEKSFLSAQKPWKKNETSELQCDEKEEAEAWRVKAEVYRKIIRKYADVINLGEQKSIPELKELVRPEDGTIKSLKKRFLDELSLAYQPPWQYEFERDFIAYARECFKFVKGIRPIHADLPVSYWLSPADVLELNAADPLDKALLLCSLLVAGDCRDARVRVLLLEGGLKHAVVTFQFKGEAYVYDASGGKEAYSGQDADALVALITFNGKKAVKTLYEFNNEEYDESE